MKCERPRAVLDSVSGRPTPKFGGGNHRSWLKAVAHRDNNPGQLGHRVQLCTPGKWSKLHTGNHWWGFPRSCWGLSTTKKKDPFLLHLRLGIKSPLLYPWNFISRVCWWQPHLESWWCRPLRKTLNECWFNTALKFADNKKQLLKLLEFNVLCLCRLKYSDTMWFFCKISLFWNCGAVFFVFLCLAFSCVSSVLFLLLTESSRGDCLSTNSHSQWIQWVRTDNVFLKH